MRRRGMGLFGTTMVAGGMYAAGRSGANTSAREHEQEARLAALERTPPPAPAYQASPLPPPPAYQGAPSPAAPPSEDRFTQLRELASLKQAGVLTYLEFEAAKQRIVASLVHDRDRFVHI